MAHGFLGQSPSPWRPMVKKIFLSLPVLLAWAWLTGQPAGPRASPQGPEETQISTAQFRLLTQPRGFLLQFVSNGKNKQVAIPRDWLIPPAEEKNEESNYVT